MPWVYVVVFSVKLKT